MKKYSCGSKEEVLAARKIAKKERAVPPPVQLSLDEILKEKELQYYIDEQIKKPGDAQRFEEWLKEEPEYPDLEESIDNYIKTDNNRNIIT